MNEPQLQVICPNCSEQVSPYVTECPYCGARVRRRAPKLERHGDSFEARQPVGQRFRKLAARRRESGSRPLASWLLILAPAILLVIQRAAGFDISEAGAIVGSVGNEWWRLLAAPFVYTDIGYLFAIGLAISIFGPGLESRIGTAGTLILLIGCGALGMLGADAASSLGLDDSLVAAGGNGVALGAAGAWTMLRLGEMRRGATGPDLVGAIVVIVALLLVPVAESTASPIAGVVGGLVGAVAGWLGARAGVGA